MRLPAIECPASSRKHRLLGSDHSLRSPRAHVDEQTGLTRSRRPVRRFRRESEPRRHPEAQRQLRGQRARCPGDSTRLRTSASGATRHTALRSRTWHDGIGRPRHSEQHPVGNSARSSRRRVRGHKHDSDQRTDTDGNRSPMPTHDTPGPTGCEAPATPRGKLACRPGWKNVLAISRAKSRHGSHVATSRLQPPPTARPIDARTLSLQDRASPTGHPPAVMHPPSRYRPSTGPCSVTATHLSPSGSGETLTDPVLGRVAKGGDSSVTPSRSGGPTRMLALGNRTS